MRKFLVFLLLLVLALGFLLFLSKDWIVRGIFESAVQTLTGFKTRIGALRLDLQKGVLTVEDLVLFNPESFEGRVFAEVPQIDLAIDLPGLLKREKIYIYDLRLVIEELHLEKNPAGISNVSLLKSVAKPGKGREASDEGVARQKPKLPFYVERLELTLRRVSFHDRSGVVPKKLAVDLRIERELFYGIGDPSSIIHLILMKLFKNTSFGNLGVNTAEIEKRLKASITAAQVWVSETLNVAQGVTQKKISDLLGREEPDLDI